ncbi:MAG: HPP family protein [Phycisphaerae bacterium]|nr:HPP family protein [Phycisphaerae bacterium]
MKKITESLREFRRHWKNYVIQSIIATLVIFAILLMLSIRKNAIIIASLGATTFIVFAMPKSITATTRNIIGGYITGIICGTLCALLPKPLFVHHAVMHSLAYAVAVGLSIFIMVVTDTEHPPASGIALAFAINGVSLEVTIAVIVAVSILALTRYLFRNQLRDLT